MMMMMTTTMMMHGRRGRVVDILARTVQLRGASERCAWSRGGQTAVFSSQSHEPDEPKESSDTVLDRVVGKLNTAIRSHPGETIAVLFASDIGCIGAMYGLLTLSGIEFSPEFALAFAASRPFRRVRLPLDLAAAAAVAKVFPAFTKVRLSELIPRMLSTADTASPSMMSKSVDKVFNVMDSYGAAYMMGSRLMGVSVVSLLYVLIKQGVDVMPLLAQLGVQDVGTALGSYAAAVVFSSALYPVTLGVTGYVVPFAAAARKSLLP
ncbi:hypothetical protein P43SY_001515 [Pythium insidiosum]|uniref:Transmembrane protein n=1 Tax=Pythium insidiosum TaxID=114742 RepID=A0AAD5M503_PYTIN|nr:hypothetical protein P43SY_001515 [Pythium insidiosum]